MEIEGGIEFKYISIYPATFLKFSLFNTFEKFETELTLQKVLEKNS